MTKSACKPLTRDVAIALLAVIALSSGYALKMAAEYAMGPGPDAAARLKVFQQEKDLYGVEYRLASETFDDEGDATYVFEAVGGEGARVVIEPRFYPVLEIEFVPAGFIRVSSPPIRVSTPFSAIWRRCSDERGAAAKISQTDDKLWLPSLSEYVPAELLSPSCSLSPSLAGEGSQYGLYQLMLHLNDQDERALLRQAGKPWNRAIVSGCRRKRGLTWWERFEAFDGVWVESKDGVSRRDAA